MLLFASVARCVHFGICRSLLLVHCCMLAFVVVVVYRAYRGVYVRLLLLLFAVALVACCRCLFLCFIGVGCLLVLLGITDYHCCYLLRVVSYCFC